jgi:Ca2+:H+ antiporter
VLKGFSEWRHSFILTVYISYLAFQLWSHTYLYHDKHNPKSSRLPATQNISAEKAAAYLSARSKSTFQSCKNFGDLDSIRSFGRNSKKLTPPRRPFVSSIYTNGSRLRQSSTATVSSPDPEHRYDPTHKYQHIEAQSETPGTIRFKHSDDTRIDGLPRRMSREETVDITSSPMPSPTSTVTYTEFGEMEQTSTSGDDETIGKPNSKEPQLSWCLTALSLLIVTAVRSPLTLSRCGIG